MNGVPRSPSDGKKPSNLQSAKKQKTEVFTDGKQYYSYVEPHKLVLSVDVHVRLLLEQEMSNQERSQDKFSAIEPFKVPLPIPPNSKVFNRFQKKLLDKDNKDTEFIKRMTEPIRDSLLSDPRGIKYQVSRIGAPDTENGPSSLDPPNAIPYNAYNLRYISMGYLYEDVWNVEETRPAIAQILLFEDYKELERKRQLKEKQRAQDAEQELLNTPSVVESTATDNSTVEEKERKLELAQRAQEKKAQDEKEKAEEMALDLEDKIGEGDIERANWSTRVVEMYPVVKELKERVYPLWRAISFGHTFDAGRKEIKDCLTNELLVNIILQHMVFERLNRSRKVLEEESRISYQWIDVDESLMHALCKEAIKKSERFFDITIADKIPPRLLQKNKKDISKEMDEMLADFGLEDEGMYGENGKLSGDINIWAETLSQDSQNLIVDSDPVNRSERFLAGSLNVLVEKLTTSVNPSALISTSQVNSSVSGSEEAASSNFALAFLATYMSFTTPDVLLTKLIQRFNIPRGMPDLEMATKKKSIQLSVLQVIRLWLTEHFSHFDNKLLSVLTSFLEEQVETEIHLKKDAGTIKSIIEKKKYDKFADDQPQQQVAKPPEPKIPLDRIFNPALSISEIDEEEVARQMTLIEFALFSAIEPQELLNQAWLKVKLRHRAPNLLKLMNHSNEISQWVASVIVTEGMKLDDRKKQLRRFINICNHLFKMNNFNSLKAVLKGLQNMAVARMKQARDSLPSDSKKIQAELEKLMAETNGNYKPYREATRALVKKNDTPMIPYLDVYLSELQLIEVNHHDFTRNPSNNVELINWNKRESSYDVISEIRKMQSRPYNFLPVHQVQQLLIQKKEKIDNQEELKNMSVRAEH